MMGWISYVLRWLLTFVASLAALWLLGFVVFVGQVQMQRTPESPKADGIVVLTGGEGRVGVGLQLLADMRGTAMLISGVHPGASKESIITAQKVDDATQRRLLTCCVDLGYAAGSTVGNAEEAVAWARDKKLNSLIIVTASYHIPRARLEFAHAFKDGALPDVELVYYPLARENVKLGAWWEAPLTYLQQFPGTTNLMMREYNKYVFAWGRATLRYAQ
ncbi:MAG: YdcF family protein [Bdellovibrionales bacterium]